jgi:hypothetical protein
MFLVAIFVIEKKKKERREGRKERRKDICVLLSA